MTSEMVKIHAFADQILKDRVFMGTFHEKRYVKQFNSYLDVIILDKYECDLCAALKKVQNFVYTQNPNVWFGFSEPHAIDAPVLDGYCIWTVLDKCDRMADDLNVATTVFGDYWFQIKAIHISYNAIEMEMKILRPIEPMASTLSNSSALTTAHQAISDIDMEKIQQLIRENVVEVNWLQLFQQWHTAINQIIFQFFSQQINSQNILHLIKMIGLFLIGTVHMSIDLIQWLGEFTLKLVFELTNLFRAMTPISLGILNLIAKVIGGFYILLAMIWRDSFGNNQNTTNKSNQSTTTKTNTTNVKMAYNRPAIGYSRKNYPISNSSNTFN